MGLIKEVNAGEAEKLDAIFGLPKSSKSGFSDSVRKLLEEDKNKEVPVLATP